MVFMVENDPHINEYGLAGIMGVVNAAL